MDADRWVLECHGCGKRHDLRVEDGYIVMSSMPDDWTFNTEDGWLCAECRAST